MSKESVCTDTEAVSKQAAHTRVPSTHTSSQEHGAGAVSGLLRSRRPACAWLYTLTGGTFAAHHRDSPSRHHFQLGNPPESPKSRIIAAGPMSTQDTHSRPVEERSLSRVPTAVPEAKDGREENQGPNCLTCQICIEQPGRAQKHLIPRQHDRHTRMSTHDPHSTRTHSHITATTLTVMSFVSGSSPVSPDGSYSGG